MRGGKTMAFKWNSDLNTGVENIDAEHNKLFSMFEIFGDACSEGWGASVVASILDDVLEYTIFHFDGEEKQLAQRNYALLAQHQEIHQDLKDRVAAYRKSVVECDHDRDALESLGMSVGGFLQDWLIQHIMEKDIPAFKG
jgi:hemerythrin-like metal-binding protein